MYVARHRQFLVKRMPETGSKHHPSCSAFEPDLGMSGLGELMGDAVIEHTPDQIELRVDFPLSRAPGKAIPKGEPTDPADIRAPRRRMSLRAMLHLLYERAGFNRWYPRMAGKRGQWVFHKFMMDAAGSMTVKGGPLSNRLYVPEPFRSEFKDDIAARRRAKLAILQSPEDDVQFKMAVVIGEFASVETTTFGRKILLKHMHDAPLYMDNKPWERVERTYGEMLRARDADVRSKPRVLMAALIYAKRAHLYQVDTLTMMLINEQWLPLESVDEVALIERLCSDGRSFIKPLAYDAKAPGAFPSVLLTDAGPKVLPLFVVNAMGDAKERAAKERSIRDAGDAAWAWHTDRAMPELPEALARHDRRQASAPSEDADLLDAGPVNLEDRERA